MKYFTKVASYSNCEIGELDSCRKSSSTPRRSLAGKRGEMLLHYCRYSGQRLKTTKDIGLKGWHKGGSRWSPLRMPSRNCIPKSHLSQVTSLHLPHQRANSSWVLVSVAHPPPYTPPGLGIRGHFNFSVCQLIIWSASLSTLTPSIPLIYFSCSSYLPQSLRGYDWELDKSWRSASCSLCDTEQATSIP